MAIFQEVSEVVGMEESSHETRKKEVKYRKDGIHTALLLYS